ncbi:MAG: MarR family winged helix-turn-helix transcriptional regulator, partial [Oscillospiraceae bacterium]|nr:MarR family winged helix-turn-helix transcriptional regulator [Oscillospiraceae bacterium]
GDEMRVSSARVAAALNSLEQKGLITRQINKDDRRKILVGVTEHGKKMAEKHRQDVIGVAAKLLNLLGEHDAKEYVRITGKLAEIAPKCIIDSPLGQ